VLTIASSNTGFYIGLSIGFAVVVVVVLVVALILVLASRIAAQARAAGEVVGQIRNNTDALHEITTTNRHAIAILSAMESARGVLTR
jgi:Sec-independent protein translocase protein TatA